MMLGSVAGSAAGGIFQTKTSFRNLMTISVIAYFIGMLLLGNMTPETSRLLLTVFMVIAGFGMGFSFSLLPTASIHNLEPRYRGSANSTNSFLRSFGMTLGITIFGTIQNKVFSNKLSDAFKGMQGAGGHHGAGFLNMNDPQEIFQPGTRSQIPDVVLSKIVHAMSDSITHIFMLSLIPIILAAITVAFMGPTKVEVSNKTVKKAQ
jgi:MFS family permease